MRTIKNKEMLEGLRPPAKLEELYSEAAEIFDQQGIAFKIAETGQNSITVKITQVKRPGVLVYR
jgi:hypothetical protein